MNYDGGRSSSLWENGNLVSEHGVVNLVEEDVEQSSGIITQIGLKLRVDLNDENGCNGGKQTGLGHQSAGV